MVSPTSRRRAVEHLMEKECSRVRSCLVVGLARSTSRTKRKERNERLSEQVLGLAAKYPRFGFRRVHAMLDGVNIKAVHRIWKKHGLSQRTRKRRRLKVEKSCLQNVTAPNQAWALDFVHERLSNGRTVRILGVLDCFTRENLLLKASPSFPACEVARELEWLFLVHGHPQRLISDNGPEFRALKTDVERSFIQPGKPWQNGYIESFFGKLRDELLSCELFDCGSELQTKLSEFQEYYNTERPHLGLSGQTPARFKERLFETTNDEILTK